MSTTRKYGWKKDSEDKRDLFHKFAVTRLQDTIKLVDLRSQCPKVYDQGHLGSCHDDQTEVLTDSGWKLFADLDDTDLLASVDPKTSKLIYEKPTRLVRFKYSGNLVCGKLTSFLDFRVTPDHKMLVRKWNQSIKKLDENYSFVDAKNIGWYCGLMSRVNWEGDNSETYILPGIPDHKLKIQRVDKPVPMKYWLRFLGIYLAEGCFCYRPGHYKIQLAAVVEEEKQFMRETLSALDLHYLELPDRFTFSNKQIYTELERLGLKGVLAPQKFVPDFVFKLSANNIKEFLTGHFAGDGCDSKTIKNHYTSSETLANDIQLLHFLSGTQSHIYVRPPRTSIMKDGRKVVGKYPEFRISICELRNSSISRKDAISTEYYDGEVFCAEVPTYHTLVTRRNYKILISGNCTSQSIAGAYEFDEMKEKEEHIFTPSRLFIYYNERKIEGSIDEDAGAMIRDGIKSINDDGICPESIWEYDITKFAVEPSKEAYESAKHHKCVEYKRVDQTLPQLKQCLIEGFPIVFGMMVYSSFESSEVSTTGVVPMPSSNESLLGGHAVLCVGFDDDKKTFIVRNSWGESWGDKGYFYLPYDYMTNTDLVADLWTVRKVVDDVDDSGGGSSHGGSYCIIM